MLKPRAVALRSLALSALFAFALPAAAQTPCPGVCIGFAAAGGVAAVPLSSAAMLLLSLLVAGAGYVAMRRRSGLMAVVLATALAGATITTDIREAIAASLYQVVLGAGNMASVNLPASYVGPVDVQNSNGSAATVTSLTVGPGFALDTATTLHVGSVVPVGGTITGAVAVDVPPVSGGAFATLADMTVSDNSGAFPISINAGGVTDPAGRGIVYSATGLPGALAINPATGVISGIYDVTSVVIPGVEYHTVTVTARPTGSSLSISKTFVLGIRNDG
jgi:hypothetical protein